MTEFSALKIEVGQLRSKVDALNQRVAADLSRIEKAKGRVGDLEDFISSTKAQGKQLVADVTQLQTDLETLDGQFQSAKTSILAQLGALDTRINAIETILGI